MKTAKEHAERHLRIARIYEEPVYGKSRDTAVLLHRDTAGLLMVVDDLERRLGNITKAVDSLADRVDRAETAAVTLRTQLQQEREAREELAATWAEAWDRRHEP